MAETEESRARAICRELRAKVEETCARRGRDVLRRQGAYTVRKPNGWMLSATEPGAKNRLHAGVLGLREGVYAVFVRGGAVLLRDCLPGRGWTSTTWEGLQARCAFPADGRHTTHRERALESKFVSSTIGLLERIIAGEGIGRRALHDVAVVDKWRPQTLKTAVAWGALQYYLAAYVFARAVYEVVSHYAGNALELARAALFQRGCPSLLPRFFACLIHLPALAGHVPRASFGVKVVNFGELRKRELDRITAPRRWLRIVQVSVEL